MHIKNHLIRKATSLFIFVTLGFASCKADMPIDTTAPGSVTNLQAKSLEGKILLTWTDPADSDLFGIKIYNGQESTARSVSLNDGILVGKGIQKYEIANLENGKKYTFKVSAVDLAGNESPIVTSEPVTFSVKITKEFINIYICPKDHKEFGSAEEAAECCGVQIEYVDKLIYIYVCPKCEKEYATAKDAADCCGVQIEYVDVVITKYVCPKDSKVYDTAEEAAVCCGVQIEYVKKYICPKCKKEFDTVEEAVKCFNTVVTETTNADGSKTITSTESKADGTKIITVEDIIDGKTVKTSVSEVAIDGSKKISDTYSSGVTVKTSVTDTGTITTSAKNKDDQDIYLTHFELPFNEWGPNYQKVIPLSDLVNTEDIILGDVLKLHMTGVLEHDSKEIETYIVSTAPEDSYWSILSPIQSDGTSDFVFAENEKVGSSFDDYYEMPVVKIMESTNFSDVYLCFKASLRENEDADTHEDSVSFMVSISAELDKTNRISPITVTINPAGGICNKTSFSAYPGYNLKLIEIKKDKMFLNGWKDSQGNFVQKVPASDILLTADWSDRLDFTKYGAENTVDGNLYHINGNILYQYPDAVLVVEFSHEKIDTEKFEWPYGALAISGNKMDWTVLSAYNDNNTEDVIFKHLVSDIISDNPNIEHIFLNQFESSKGFTVNGFYLDYNVTNITYELNGGSMDVTKETLPANTPLNHIPKKDGVLFGGWVDENNLPVIAAPEEDCTLYATWGDKLDLITLLTPENEIEVDALKALYKEYPNANFGYKVTPILDGTDKQWGLLVNSPLMHPIRNYFYAAENEDDFDFYSPDNIDSLSLKDLIKLCDIYKASKIIFYYVGNFSLNEVFLTYNKNTLILPELELNGGSETDDETKPPVMRKDSSIFGYTLSFNEDGSYAAVYFHEYNPKGELIDASYWYVTKTGFTLEGVYRDENFTIPCGDENSLFTVGNEAKFYLKWIEN